HRNYLPIFGPIFAAITGVTMMASNASKLVRAGIPVALLFSLSAVTVVRALDWGDLDALRLSLAYHKPNSARSNYEAGLALGSAALANPIFAPVFYGETKRYFERSAELDPNSLNGLFSLILLESTNQNAPSEA